MDAWRETIHNDIMKVKQEAIDRGEANRGSRGSSGHRHNDRRVTPEKKKHWIQQFPSAWSLSGMETPRCARTGLRTVRIKWQEAHLRAHLEGAAQDLQHHGR